MIPKRVILLIFTLDCLSKTTQISMPWKTFWGRGPTEGFWFGARLPLWKYTSFQTFSFLRSLPPPPPLSEVQWHSMEWGGGGNIFWSHKLKNIILRIFRKPLTIMVCVPVCLLEPSQNVAFFPSITIEVFCHHFKFECTYCHQVKYSFCSYELLGHLPASSVFFAPARQKQYNGLILHSQVATSSL